MHNPFFWGKTRKGGPTRVPARKGSNRVSPKQQYIITMPSLHPCNHFTALPCAALNQHGVPPPLSAAAMQRTKRNPIQSPKADMQNTCCRHCTNPHKLPCLRACYPNTNAADMRQCWATGSQQFPGGAGPRRHPKKTCIKHKPTSSLCQVKVQLGHDNDARDVSANFDPLPTDFLRQTTPPTNDC